MSVSTFVLTESEIRECARNPVVLRALADWREVQLLEMDSIGLADFGVEARQSQLLAEAERIEREVVNG